MHRVPYPSHQVAAHAARDRHDLEPDVVASDRARGQAWADPLQPLPCRRVPPAFRLRRMPQDRLEGADDVVDEVLRMPHEDLRGKAGGLLQGLPRHGFGAASERRTQGDVLHGMPQAPCLGRYGPRYLPCVPQRHEGTQETWRSVHEVPSFQGEKDLTIVETGFDVKEAGGWND